MRIQYVFWMQLLVSRENEMLKKYWYLLLLVMLFVSGCGAGSSGPSTTTSPPAVVPTPTTCVGAGVGPRNQLVVVDCPTETSGTERVLERTIRVSNSSSRTVAVETDKGVYDVPPGANFEAPNSAKAVNWYLK